MDEINNRSYTKSQLLNEGLYDIIATDDLKAWALLKQVYDHVCFLRPCTGYLYEIYKDGKNLGSFPGYLRAVENAGIILIREPKKLFYALGFICAYPDKETSYDCIDIYSNKFCFPKELYYGQYTTGISIYDLISKLRMSGNYECNTELLGAENNVRFVRLDISTTSEGSGKFDTNGMDVDSKALDIMENKYNTNTNIKIRLIMVVCVFLQWKGWGKIAELVLRTYSLMEDMVQC